MRAGIYTLMLMVLRPIYKEQTMKKATIPTSQECLAMASTLNYTVKCYIALVERSKFDFGKIHKHLNFYIKQLNKG